MENIALNFSRQEIESWNDIDGKPDTKYLPSFENELI